MSGQLLIGVLGGMGPLATLDLQQKIIEETPAARDQEHVPVVAWNVPQIPDRQLALAGKGPSPLPALLAAVERLNRIGASHIVIACNTAHHWYDELAAASTAPLLHIVDACADELRAGAPDKVGIIATAGTLAAGWYQQRLAAQGITALLPAQTELERLFVPGCYAVKRGELQRGGELLDELANALLARGAQKLVLACTEVPPALVAVQSRSLPLALDPARALARQCVRLWQESQRRSNADAALERRT